MHNLPSLLKGASGGINSLFTLKYSLLRYYRDNLKLYVHPLKVTYCVPPSLIARLYYGIT